MGCLLAPFRWLFRRSPKKAAEQRTPNAAAAEQPKRAAAVSAIRRPRRLRLPAEFVVLDFETANAHRSSICQIGLVRYSGGAIVDSWSSLVNPKAPFADLNVKIHGITANAVRGAPTFRDVYPYLRSQIEGRTVLSHTTFDLSCIERAIAEHNLAPIPCDWLDTRAFARRAWPDRAAGKYGLAPLCKSLDIALEHHDALSDAKAAGEVAIRAAAIISAAKR